MCKPLLCPDNLSRQSPLCPDNLSRQSAQTPTLSRQFVQTKSANPYFVQTICPDKHYISSTLSGQTRWGGRGLLCLDNLSRQMRGTAGARLSRQTRVCPDKMSRQTVGVCVQTPILKGLLTDAARHYGRQLARVADNTDSSAGLIESQSELRHDILRQLTAASQRYRAHLASEDGNCARIPAASPDQSAVHE